MVANARLKPKPSQFRPRRASSCERRIFPIFLIRFFSSSFFVRLSAERRCRNFPECASSQASNSPTLIFHHQSEVMDGLAMASPFHSFPLPPPTDRRIGCLPPEVVVGIHLETTPRFLSYKLAKKAAHREWQRTERERCLEGEFATATSVDLSDDGDSCQKVEATSSSDDGSLTLSDNSCDENPSLPKPRRVFSGDYFQFADHSHMMLLSYNPFGPIAAVIARDSQGSWHKSAQYTTHQILEFLEYDPQTCWDEEPDAVVEIGELMLASESPPTHAEHKRKEQEKQDTIRTRRILHTLWCKGLRVHDLQCWLPPVDLQDKLNEQICGLRVEWKKRKAARSRALRFFRSLPTITNEHTSEVANVNVEVGENCWRGYYRLITTRNADATISWSIQFNQSFREVLDLDQLNMQPPKPAAQMTAVDNVTQNDDEEKHEKKFEELNNNDDDEELSNDNDEELSTDETDDDGSADDEGDDEHHSQSQSSYHLLSQALGGWEYYNKWNDPQHAHNAERYREQYEHLRSKLRRLAVGPSPGDVDATAAFLLSTCSLSGRVYENALTSLLLQWLVMPNDELRKTRYQNPVWQMSARLRALAIWMLLNVDVALIARVQSTDLDENSELMTSATSVTTDDNLVVITTERLRLWLAIIPIFHTLGHAAIHMRVQLQFRGQIDGAKRKCRICYIPSKLHSQKKQKPYLSKEEHAYMLEAQVREWFTEHEPTYEPIFLTQDNEEAMQAQWPFEYMTGWTSAHAMQLLRADCALQKRRDGEQVFIEAQQPLSAAATGADANMPQFFTYAGLNHYGTLQTRTFCYYTLITWPPLQADSSSSNVLHPFWLSAKTLRPCSFEQSTTYHLGNVVYWNRLVRLFCEWLAMTPEELGAVILLEASSSPSAASSSVTAPLPSPCNQSVLLACYRQAIVACLRALWD